ncbi:MAG: hypothetical protein PUB53_01675 [Bacteroidales bacterium]|nr:hypothetical protein [Bacteroidales bacterium]
MPQKSFNPSANPSLLLILNRKVAEGFGFQTLQTLQLWPEKTRAGLDQTTRRVVSPKPGLVGMMQEEADDGENAISNTYRLNHPEGFEIQTLQPLSR